MKLSAGQRDGSEPQTGGFAGLLRPFAVLAAAVATLAVLLGSSRAVGDTVKAASQVAPAKGATSVSRLSLLAVAAAVMVGGSLFLPSVNSLWSKNLTISGSADVISDCSDYKVEYWKKVVHYYWEHGYKKYKTTYYYKLKGGGEGCKDVSNWSLPVCFDPDKVPAGHVLRTEEPSGWDYAPSGSGYLVKWQTDGLEVDVGNGPFDYPDNVFNFTLAGYGHPLVEEEATVKAGQSSFTSAVSVPWPTKLCDDPPSAQSGLRVQSLEVESLAAPADAPTEEMVEDAAGWPEDALIPEKHFGHDEEEWPGSQVPLEDEESATPTATPANKGTAQTTPQASATPKASDLTGCKPGFWLSHVDAWDGKDGDDLTTDVQSADTFASWFSDSNKDSLLAVLGYESTGLKGLQRATISALLSADAMADYPFSKTEVVAKYKTAVAAGDASITSAKAAFEALEGNCAIEPVSTTPVPSATPSGSATPAGPATPASTATPASSPTQNPNPTPTQTPTAAATATKTSAAVPTPSGTPQP